MICGADRDYKLPHSGYDDSLRSGKNTGYDSDTKDPNSLNDEIPFIELSHDFPEIRDLEEHEIPLSFSHPSLHYRGRGIIPQLPEPESSPQDKKGKGKEREKDPAPAPALSPDQILKQREMSQIPWPPVPESYVMAPVPEKFVQRKPLSFILDLSHEYYLAPARQIPVPAMTTSPLEPAPGDNLLPIYVDSDDESPTREYMDISDRDVLSDRDVRPGEIMDIVSSDESAGEIPVGNLGWSSNDDNQVGGLPMSLDMPDSDSDKFPVDESNPEIEAGKALSRQYTAASFSEFQDDWVD
jgi:hypothetical protein